MSHAIVEYLRVSTQKQGQSGLGLEAQASMITGFATMTGAKIVASYTDIESGKNDDRPELARAIEHAKRIKAVLVVASLDRLSRDVHFISGLMKTGLDFRLADTPQASTFEIHLRAVLAEEERRKVSERTRNALRAAKARGTVLGGFRGVSFDAKARVKAVEARRANASTHGAATREALSDLDLSGLTLRQIGSALEARGVTTSRGGITWTASAVKRALAA